MAYDLLLAARVQDYLDQQGVQKVEPREMFRGLCFMVDDKMCINISGDNLMCRFDPARGDELTERSGFLPMVMRGRTLTGYCYVSPEGFVKEEDFRFWLDACLEFNARAKKSKRRKG